MTATPNANAAPGRALFGLASVYGLVTLVQSMAFLFVLPVVTRAIGAKEYGVVAACVAVYQVLLVLAPAGLPSVVAWDMYERGDDGLPAARRLAASTVALAAFVVLVVHLSGPLWTRIFSGVGYQAAMTIAVWTVVPGSALAVSQALLQAQKRAPAFAVCTLTSVAGGQLLGLAIVTMSDAGASGYLAGVAVGTAAGAAIGLALTRVRFWRPVGPALVRPALAHGSPTVAHGAAFIVLAAGDRIIVERLMGLESAGRYQVAYLVGAVGLSAVLAVNNAWAPLFHSAAEEVRWDLLRDTTTLVYQVAALVAAGLAVGAPLALVVLAPSSYRPADLAPVSAVVASSVLPYVTYLSAVHVLFQVKRTGALAWATPLAAGANLALNFLLIPPFGLVGSALATLLGYLLWAGLVRWAARRARPVEWSRAVERRSYVLAGIFVLAGAVAPATGPWLVGRGVAAGALLVWLLARVRAAFSGPGMAAASVADTAADGETI